MTAFSSGAGDTLDALSYGIDAPGESQLAELRVAALQWLKSHHAREAEALC